MHFLRSMIGKSRSSRIINEMNRETVKEENLQDMIEKAKLKQYGLLKRMKEERITKKMYETEIRTNRPTGRPRDR